MIASESEAGTLYEPDARELPSNWVAVRPESPWLARPPAIAGYEILRELGRGNMGVVYQARQAGIERVVALKMVLAGIHARVTDLQRFLTEACVVGRLQHPNIVQVHEVGQCDGVPFFSMEYISGGTLARQLGGRPRPFREAANLVRTLARAVHYAHERGVVHRDLKPANILLAPIEHRSRGSSNALAPGLWIDGEQTWMPKVADFGLAKQLDVPVGNTQSDAVLGTPAYMAPEQAEGRSRHVGPAADVYALGVILYETLTGRPPHNAASPAETVLLLFNSEPPPPSRLQPRLPRDLETICLKCLQKDPRRRYATAEALAVDLERFLAGEPIAARPISWVEQLWKWSRRRPVAATLTACSVAAVVLGGAAVVWHQVDLQNELNHALARERAGREAEEAAANAVRLAAERDRVKDCLHLAEEALARNDWTEARVQLARVHDDSAAGPELAELYARADHLLRQTEERQSVRSRYERFVQRRNDALFHAALFGANDLATSLRAVDTAAREALACFDVEIDQQGAPKTDTPYLTEDEKVEVAQGCYELLLTLAAAVAQPRADLSLEEQRCTVEESLRILDRAESLGPSTRAYHLRRADLLGRMDDGERALRERERAAALQPSTALGHFLDGDEHYRHGNWNAAIQAFEAALRLQPDYFWARYYLALCWLKTQRPDRAEQALTACLGWRPHFPWLYLLRGSTLSELGRFSEAEADFEQAQTYSLDDAGRYALLVNRGVLRVRQSRLAEAERDLEAAVVLRPHLYQGHVNLAEVYVQQKHYVPALEQLNRAVECEPGLAALYRTRAYVHARQQDFSAALRDLERGLALEPSSRLRAASHLERSRLLHDLGDEAEALRACEAAIAEEASPAAHRLHAEILLTLERLPEARAALDACLQNGPLDAAVLKTRAAVLSRLGRYPAALADYTQALELSPDAAGFAARGWVYIVTDAPRLAVADFDEAVRRDPKSADARLGRGFARARLNQYRSAAADAEAGLRLGPISIRSHYNAARIFAQVSQGVNEFNSTQRREFQTRAVNHLRQALDATAEPARQRFWRETVLQDAALLPLRGTTEFLELSARYHSGTKVDH